MAALSSNAGIGKVGIENELNWERSALSMHAKDRHKDNFSLKNFSVAVIKKVSPQNLRREEFCYIEMYKTISLGLNRYEV